MPTKLAPSTKGTSTIVRRAVEHELMMIAAPPTASANIPAIQRVFMSSIALRHGAPFAPLPECECAANPPNLLAHLPPVPSHFHDRNDQRFDALTTRRGNALEVAESSSSVQALLASRAGAPTADFGFAPVALAKLALNLGFIQYRGLKTGFCSRQNKTLEKNSVPYGTVGEMRVLFRTEHSPNISACSVRNKRV